MVPPAMFPDRSIVFLGYTMSLNTTLLAEVQALWAAAFLNNEFPAGSPLTTMTIADWMLETTKHTEFGKWRSPRANGGRHHPNFVFDILPYLDLLLRDLGISPRRKVGFWAHWMQPHGINDYHGLITEWRVAMGNTQESSRRHKRGNFRLRIGSISRVHERNVTTHRPPVNGALLAVATLKLHTIKM